MMCYTVNSMAVRMKYGDLPISAFIIFPLNYGTIPRAEKQEEEALFCLDGAYFSVIVWFRWWSRGGGRS